MGTFLNKGEYRRGNQKWTIQRNWQHSGHKTNKTKTQYILYMCWTPLCANNVNKT
jgi:hypothetical protein